VNTLNKHSKTIAAIISAVSLYIDDEGSPHVNEIADLKLNKWKMVPLQNAIRNRWFLSSSIR
tara:strand:- start:122 stop:307 length:186 start_codon:yes stop_codon:yes gene_type:complete